MKSISLLVVRFNLTTQVTLESLEQQKVYDNFVWEDKSITSLVDYCYIECLLVFPSGRRIRTKRFKNFALTYQYLNKLLVGGWMDSPSYDCAWHMVLQLELTDRVPECVSTKTSLPAGVVDEEVPLS